MLKNLLHSFPSYAFFIQLGGSLFVLLIFLLFRKLVHKGIFNFLKRKQHVLTHILDEMTTSLERPLDYLWVLTGCYLAIIFSPFINHPSFKQPLLIIGELELPLHFIPFDLLNKGYATLFIIGLTWGAYNFVDIYEKLLLKIGSKFTLFDNALIIRFTAKIIKFIVMVIGIGLVISQFIHLGNILTGVGIAGAAFTFIAKDTLTDIMSGVVLMVDTPFTIGDWVAVGTLEGIVEDVSFRSTRIRTFEQGLVVIPNATLANDNILNWSTMPKRRHRFSLGVTYDTSKETLTTFIESLKKELQELEAIESDSLLVFFDNYGDFSLNIIVQYFTTNIDLKSYSALKEQVNLIIMDLAHTHQVSIAFPTQTIHLQKD